MEVNPAHSSSLFGHVRKIRDSIDARRLMAYSRGCLMLNGCAKNFRTVSTLAEVERIAEENILHTEDRSPKSGEISYSGRLLIHFMTTETSEINLQGRQRATGQSDRGRVAQIGVAALRKRVNQTAHCASLSSAGGCSGLQYTMDLVEGPANRDILIQASDVRVVVDPKSALFRQRFGARLQ